MLRTKSGLRVLGPDDLPEVLALLSADPVCNVFVEYRARQTKLNPHWLGGEVWGYLSDGELRALCHAGANLVPVNADSDALDTFATRAATKGRSCSSIVGLTDQVAELGRRLRWQWGPARLVREGQPFMKIDRPPRPTSSRHPKTASDPRCSLDPAAAPASPAGGRRWC